MNRRARQEARDRRTLEALRGVPAFEGRSVLLLVGPTPAPARPLELAEALLEEAPGALRLAPLMGCRRVVPLDARRLRHWRRALERLGQAARHANRLARLARLLAGPDRADLCRFAIGPWKNQLPPALALAGEDAPLMRQLPPSMVEMAARAFLRTAVLNGCRVTRRALRSIALPRLDAHHRSTRAREQTAAFVERVERWERGLGAHPDDVFDPADVLDALPEHPGARAHRLARARWGTWPRS